jgi:hypothetical protein
VNKLAACSSRSDLGLVFLLGFLLWLLNHPYQGVQHDAQIYGLLAAHWIKPEAFANDLFFKFGSQGTFSLFTPLFGELVRWLGLGRAAWWVVFGGGLLWVGACLVLARTMLGAGFAARFATMLGAVAVISYSPNLSTFTLGENFATARSLAIPLGVASVAALAANRQAWSLALGSVAAILHPLHGIWPLLLWVLARARVAYAVILVLLPLAAVFLLGLMNLDLPYLRLMTGDWRDAAVGPASDIVFQSPLRSRLPIYLGVLVALWVGARRGSEEGRDLYLRLLLLGSGGLGLALVASYWIPIEIVVQGQPWRVMALLIPLAGLAIVDVGQRAWRSSVMGRLLVGAIAVLASIGPALLIGGLCAVGMASLLPAARIERIMIRADHWRGWLLAALVLCALLVLPNILADWDISGGQLVNPWWTGAAWLHGLLAGGNWHLAAMVALGLGYLSSGDKPGGTRRPSTLIAVLMAVVLMLAATLYNWDRRVDRTRIAQACFLDASCPPHPFRQWIAPGTTVFWPGGETIIWFELMTASYSGDLQAAGRVFSAAKFYEWQRRREWIAAGTDPRHLCADPILDWVVLRHSVPGLSPQAILGNAQLYACKALRAASPAPTFVEAR